MNAVDVTTVVPTFRRPQQVVEAVRSVLAQDGVSIEVRVIDDSPEGSAREALDAIGDSRVTYARRATPSQGRPALVRNETWPDARGRYIHFLDDDDVVASGAYRAHVDALDAHENASMSFGCIEAFGEDAAAVEAEIRFWQKGAERARRAARFGRFGLVATMLFDDAVLQSSACMVRKAALEAIGGFDPQMPLQEDTEMYARVTRRFGCVYIDRTVVHYRVNPTSLMRSGDVQARINESYSRMHRKYHQTHGYSEFLAMKLFVRGRSVLSRVRQRFPRAT